MPRQGRLIAFACAFLILLMGTAKAGARPRPASVAPVLGGAPTSAPIPPGFLGFSMEFYAVHQYVGSDPNQVNPVLVQLIRNLTPGQAPVLRIGGDSTDQSWWPVPGVLPPRGIDYPLTRGWIRTVAALSQTLSAKLIVGVNLMLGQPALAAVEARALLAGLGGSLAAFEIGNESDLYGTLPWYLTASRKAVYGRRRSYSVSSFLRDETSVRSGLPAAPIAGPGFANLTWTAAGLGPFMATTPRLAIVTLHRYPLRGCHVPSTSPAYPTIANLLSDYAQSNMAAGVAPYVAMAHAQGVPFRIDEMNSVACAGIHAVSDTFASALWMLDTLFEYANVGVDGVNVHTLPAAVYAPFSFTRTAGGWQADVHPEYYGMLMFAQAAPPGSRLLPVGGVPDGSLKVWATVDPQGVERVVLINEDVSYPQSVVLQAPGSAATVEELTAPSADATSDVTLGGQSFGDQTSTGVLPGPAQTGAVYPVLGLYSVTVPPASAAMLTLR
ncbi:MAG: hypothetical protein QOJ25_3059 [Solirubrobacteraceae bacterium]|nr:hypothetical protein [Solirubrobacteraceae bacterium]